ncbi:MAG TPA: energy transducer TonB [Puia sp.]|jgi:TonB family protein|nr:energy transducer TonB [Puia sp.]
MAITNTSKLTNICVIAAFSIGGLVACNSNDYRSSDASDSTAINSNKVASADSTASRDSSAMAATKKTKKKGRASILMPAGSNDMAAKGAMVKDKDGVYSSVQVMPEFPGGQDALASYVNNHVEYPQQAIDDNTTGTVKVSFVVDENGKIANAHLIDNNKLGKGLDEEALRVVNNMPAWKPGKVKGKNVKTRLELPITFQFES